METGPKLVLGCIGTLVLLCLLGTVFKSGSDTSTGSSTGIRTDSDRPSTSPRVFVPAASVAPTTYQVTYAIAGTARSASLTYENAGGNTEQKDAVPVPWSTTFRVERGAFLYIAAQNNGETGAISCEIKLDGAVIEQASSEGAYTIATCSGRAR